MRSRRTLFGPGIFLGIKLQLGHGKYVLLYTYIYSIYIYIHTHISMIIYVYIYIIYIYRCGKFIGKSQNARTSFTDGGYHERRVHNVPWRISARTRKRQRKLAVMQLRQLETVSDLGAPKLPSGDETWVGGKSMKIHHL